MDIMQITDFFKWMLIINIVIFLVSSILLLLFKDLVKRIHAKLFGIETKDVLVLTYAYLGLYKVMIIVFNFVPYISLLLIK